MLGAWKVGFTSASSNGVSQASHTCIMLTSQDFYEDLLRKMYTESPELCLTLNKDSKMLNVVTVIPTQQEMIKILR